MYRARAKDAASSAKRLSFAGSETSSADAASRNLERGGGVWGSGGGGGAFIIYHLALRSSGS